MELWFYGIICEAGGKFSLCIDKSFTIALFIALVMRMSGFRSESGTLLAYTISDSLVQWAVPIFW
jgi:hypothetical protein